MKTTKKIIFILVLCIGIIALSCDNKNTSEDNNLEKIKREQLENIAVYGAQPQLKKATQAFEELSKSAEDFRNTVTSENLQKLKVSFKKAILNWKSCEIYNIGEVKNLYLYSSINTLAEDKRIEKAIDTDKTINQEYVKNLGSSLRSISAAEYLIYHKDETQTIEDFKNEPGRGAYLVMICKILIQKSEEIEKAWEDYAQDFVSPTDNILEDGQNLSVNALVSALEFIKNVKLGDPLGDKTGRVIPEKLEAYRSRLSLEIIKNNIASIEMMFNGDYPNSKNHIGFDDYLIAKDNSNIAIKISNQIAKLKETADKLSSESLYELIKNDTDKVRNLQKETTNTLRLIKRDLKEATDATITIGDTDGD